MAKSDHGFKVHVWNCLLGQNILQRLGLPLSQKAKASAFKNLGPWSPDQVHTGGEKLTRTELTGITVAYSKELGKDPLVGITS
jgi:hypothetical protein